jgi:hypothetical protein
MLTSDKKIHIYNFVESLNVDKRGELYNKIYEHIEQNPKRKPEEGRDKD